MRLLSFCLVPAACALFTFCPASAAPVLLAGTGRSDITHPDHEAKANPLWAKALALSLGDHHAVIVTIDAVAIGEIGSISDQFLKELRSSLAADPGIDPDAIVVNASHCHGIVCRDITQKTIEAVRLAWKNRVPAKVGSGSGRENRIMQNRRLFLKDGREADVRHAYSLPPNAEVVKVGPTDPEIGILRFNRVRDGRPLAVVYQFACHPIQGSPDGSNGADLTGFASQVIENNLADDGSCTALFLQGCGGDINPAYYKTMDFPRDAETLGNLLGLSSLKAIRSIPCDDPAILRVASERLRLPRANLEKKITEMEAGIDQLIASFRGTTLDFEKFLPLYVKYHLNSNFPAAESHRYLQDEALKQDHWKRLDQNNRAAMGGYLANIRKMEELTRRQINLALLKKHQARNQAAGPTLEAEVNALRIGNFLLVTFPAELTVQIGLNIKKAAPAGRVFVSGYTNGYLYYAPTADQLRNRGGAQEDSDCLLAPEWQKRFESKALELLKKMAD